MRIAILSDIHGNHFALEAVLEDIQQQRIDEVIVGGDLVGRGPQGSEVVDTIAGTGWKCVRGNHEDYLISFFHDEIPDHWHGMDEWKAARWMANNLSQKHISYLNALPFSVTSDLFPSLRVVHGSPRSNCEGIGHWTSDANLVSYFDQIDEDILVCAHTHRAMHKHLYNKLVVNTGSVGLPFNGDWRAQYAIINTDNQPFTVQFRQVQYDRSAFLAYYESSGFLAHGNITAFLLYLEVQHARPCLVPYLRWCKAHHLEVTKANLSDFFDVFDPHKPLHEFFNSLP